MLLFNKHVTTCLVIFTNHLYNTTLFKFIAADLRIYSFTLILSVDYLMKIADFFTSVAPKVEEGSATTTAKPTTSKMQVQKINTVEENPVQMTVNIKVEMPDIILVEHMDNEDTNAMILNVS